MTLDLEIQGGKVRRVRVDMGEPILEAAKIPTLLKGNPPIEQTICYTPEPGNTLNVTCVSMGNPHAVTFVDELTKKLVHTVGPLVETHEVFPRKVNVEFVKVNSRTDAHMRVWERGSGETLACGTGACAVGVAGMLTDRFDRKVTIHLLGGDLEIEWGDRQPRVQDRPSRRSLQRRLARFTRVMKLRDPKTIRRVARAAVFIARGWVRTMRFAYRPLTAYVANDRPELLGNSRFIYLYWHDQSFAPASLFGRPDVAVLIGTHADGELMAQAAQRFGLKTVRGSSTRGGTVALLRILRNMPDTRHLALTPDGPKGPRRKCQIGAVYLASRTGRPIVAAGFGYSRCWRAGSWDRFVVPRPFSRVRCVTWHPIHVPPNLGVTELEVYRQMVEDALNQVTRIAENWVVTGEFDPLDYKPPADAIVVPEHQKAWPSVTMLHGFAKRPRQ